MSECFARQGNLAALLIDEDDNSKICKMALPENRIILRYSANKTQSYQPLLKKI
jgi:hypothetical protein